MTKTTTEKEAREAIEAWRSHSPGYEKLATYIDKLRDASVEEAVAAEREQAGSLQANAYSKNREVHRRALCSRTRTPCH